MPKPKSTPNLIKENAGFIDRVRKTRGMRPYDDVPPGTLVLQVLKIRNMFEPKFTEEGIIQNNTRSHVNRAPEVIKDPEDTCGNTYDTGRLSGIYDNRTGLTYTLTANKPVPTFKYIVYDKTLDGDIGKDVPRVGPDNQPDNDRDAAYEDDDGHLWYIIVIDFQKDKDVSERGEGINWVKIKLVPNAAYPTPHRCLLCDNTVQRYNTAVSDSKCNSRSFDVFYAEDGEKITFDNYRLLAIHVPDIVYDYWEVIGGIM